MIHHHADLVNFYAKMCLTPIDCRYRMCLVKLDRKENCMDSVRVSLRASRVNANLTIKDVSEALKVTQQTIRRWESGKTEPSASEFLRLCEMYQISPNNVFLP